ncbi:hypothetical protein AVEN_38058-1 [Araneus ventricosus]|uniref:Uncharacterized protein n=1 Tax=Araneus ventricosus TaxID=182803 RepID=A0A4Y2J044_ARAVE|nr:hypothetical protein AVEN_38058-1 [Araneus ventricosus]
MKDEQTDNDQNSKNGDVSDAEEWVLSLRKSLTELEEKSGKMSGITVEEYVTADELRWSLWFLQELLKKTFCLKSLTKWKLMIKRTMMMIQIHRNLYLHPWNTFNQFSPYGHFFQAFHPQMVIIFVH